MFEVVKRATLLYPSPSIKDPNRKHLFIILTDPFGPAKQVLLTSVSTIHGSNCDKTCILNSGHHNFLNNESFVNYAFCRVEPADKLIRGVQTKQFIDKGLISEEVYQLIISGLKASKCTKPFVLQFLNEAIR